MIRFCLIGCGRAGMVHARNLLRRTRMGSLVALCDANRDVLDAAGEELGVGLRFTDHREACASAEIDAVIVVTPVHLHRQVACDAARAGKHILLEKPMALNAEECVAIESAVSEAGVKLQLAFMRRFDESFQRAKEAIESGRMGRVMLIKSTGRGPGLPPPWIYDVSRSNGILAEVNSHDFDSVRWLVGSDITRVHAEGANFKCHDAAEEFPDFYDTAVVSLRFENGTLGVVDGCCPAGYGYDARVEILCENGLVCVGSSIEAGFTEIQVGDAARQRPVRSWRTLFRDAYVSELESFVESIEADQVPRVTGLDGRRAVEAVAASNLSLREGRPVDLRTEGANH